MNVFEQFQKAEAAISKDGNTFTLFGLFRREDVPNKYDVIASAYWLPGGRDSLNLLAELVRRSIGSDEWWHLIGKFVILSPEDPFVQAILNEMPTDRLEHGLKVIHQVPYGDDMIRDAAIITAVRPGAEHRMPQLAAA